MKKIKELWKKATTLTLAQVNLREKNGIIYLMIENEAIKSYTNETKVSEIINDIITTRATQKVFNND